MKKPTSAIPLTVSSNQTDIKENAWRDTGKTLSGICLQELSDTIKQERMKLREGQALTAKNITTKQSGKVIHPKDVNLFDLFAGRIKLGEAVSSASLVHSPIIKTHNYNNKNKCFSQCNSNEKSSSKPQ